MNREELLAAIDKKYKAMGQDPDVHLSGLLYAEPMQYWDFIQLEALLGLQTQRTQLPDEMIFIVYHQLNELLFKMILWEIDQISNAENIDPEKFAMHITRVSRYFDMLTSSFDIIGEGMEYEQYMKFRDTLTPASGFQSVQYRKIELSSTEFTNLIDLRFRSKIDKNASSEDAFENMYWQVAGKDFKTGVKNKLLTNFENKYKKELIDYMEDKKSSNIWSIFKQLPQEYQKKQKLIDAMRHYDYTVNIDWVIKHLNVTKKYLGNSKGTGGSDWQKYMHPKYQRRIFFPELWSKEEIENWGSDV